MQQTNHPRWQQMAVASAAGEKSYIQTNVVMSLGAVRFWSKYCAAGKGNKALPLL
jgi:hypothetical protein